MDYDIIRNEPGDILIGGVVLIDHGAFRDELNRLSLDCYGKTYTELTSISRVRAIPTTVAAFYVEGAFTNGVIERFVGPPTGQPFT